MAPVEKAREVQVTREYAASVRAGGFPITVERAFEASSFGGFHGDGSPVIVYRYPPPESDTLINTLKRKERSFVWKAIALGQYDFSSLQTCFPLISCPAPETSQLLVGCPAEGPPVQEFAVDRSRGILYVFRNQY